ncbi:MAG TPA: hypothetical protein VFM18_20265 [Methanosarcina sp.]|nr:hypothetical protein [Methanosarcina sp.]
MGCWNKTCGLTGLPIFAGEDVYVFVLEKNMSDSDRCYSTAFWRPVLLPFYSVYDDYGGGEDSSGIGFPILMEVLKNKIVEMEQGDNEYHDIPVTKENFGEKMFFEAVHEHRLFLPERYQKGQIPVDYVMFRKDVVDFILDTNVIELYVGRGKGNKGGNNYIDVKFDDIIADVDKYLDRIIKTVSDLKSENPDRGFGSIGYRLRTYLKLWRDEQSTLVDDFIVVDNYNMSTIFDFSDLFAQSIMHENVDREKIKEFLIDYMKGCYLNYFMESTRKNWMPGGHEGSQSEVNSEYETLIAAMQMSITKHKVEYEE